MKMVCSPAATSVGCNAAMLSQNVGFVTWPSCNELTCPLVKIHLIHMQTERHGSQITSNDWRFELSEIVWRLTVLFWNRTSRLVRYIRPFVPQCRRADHGGCVPKGREHHYQMESNSTDWHTNSDTPAVGHPFLAWEGIIELFEGLGRHCHISW